MLHTTYQKSTPSSCIDRASGHHIFANMSYSPTAGYPAGYRSRNSSTASRYTPDTYIPPPPQPTSGYPYAYGAAPQRTSRPLPMEPMTPHRRSSYVLTPGSVPQSESRRPTVPNPPYPSAVSDPYIRPAEHDRKRCSSGSSHSRQSTRSHGSRRSHHSDRERDREQDRDRYAYLDDERERRRRERGRERRDREEYSRRKSPRREERKPTMSDSE